MRKVDVATGTVLQSHPLPFDDFGEGATRHGDRLYQLVWLRSTVWSYPVHSALGEDVQQHQSDLRFVGDVCLHCFTGRTANRPTPQTTPLQHPFLQPLGTDGALPAMAHTSSSLTAAPR